METPHFFIAATAHSPLVHYNATDGTLRVEGPSVMEDATTFYLGVIDQMKWALRSQKPRNLQATIAFTALNTCTEKYVALLLNLLEITYPASRCSVVWVASPLEPGLLPLGQHLAAMLGLPFEIREPVLV